MKRRNITAVVIVLVIVAITATSLVNAGPNNQGDTPEAAPTPSAPGFFIVGSKNLEPLDFHHSGDLQSYPWSLLNPAQGQYNWTPIDTYLNQHYWPPGPGQPGKKVGITITTYDGRYDGGAAAMPAWVRQQANTTLPGTMTQAVTNGDFETDLSHWSTEGPAAISSSNPHGGSKAARMGGTPNSTARFIQYNVLNSQTC